MIRALAPTIGLLLLSIAPPLHGNEPVGETPTEWPLRLLDARHEAVRFDRWEEDGVLVFRTSGGATDEEVLRCDPREIVRFGRGAAARGGQGLLLVDGSFLVGRIAQITDAQCVLSGRYFDASIPRPLVRAVLLSAPPIDGLQAQIMRDAFSAVGGDDIAIGVDGDRTIGALQPVSPRDAVVWERGVDALEMVAGGREVRLPTTRIRALIFSPLLTPVFAADADWTTVGLADGTRLHVERLQMTERSELQSITSRQGEPEAIRWELVCGAAITAPARQWSPAAVTYISPQRVGDSAPSATAQRLSDQPPLRMRVQPMLGSARDVDPPATEPWSAGGVRVQNHWYENAIAMPSGAQAVYRGVAAGGNLRAEVAIRDPNAPDSAVGSVRFRVLVAGEAGQLQEVWKSELIQGGGGLVTVDVPLPPTRALVLAVDPGAWGVAGDRAVWIDPILTSR